MNTDQQPICANGRVLFVVKKISQHDVTPHSNLIAQNPLEGASRNPDQNNATKKTGGDRS